MTMISKNTIIVILVLILLVAVGVYYFVIQKETSKTPAVSEKVAPPPTQATTTSETKTYRNEEWGFEFEYPDGWIVKENTFGSYYSKFNILITPNLAEQYPCPILVNVVLNEFVDNSFKNIGKKLLSTA